MGTLLWLNGDSAPDYEAWLRIWEKSRIRRPHDHPGYLHALRPDGYAPAAAWYERAPGIEVFYPFYWRSLSDLPFCTAGSGPLLHLVSPYGYGGALYEGPADQHQTVSAEFEAHFRAEAARRGVVSEFVREDLCQERLATRSQGEHLLQQPNVSVRLDRTTEQIWRDYHPKVRKNVKRALQCGLRVEFDPAGAHLEQFLAVYRETMMRTHASGSFFLARERFELLGRTLGAAGGLTYVHVLDGDRVISTELLLLSSRTMYSFLGGTLASAFDKRPNDLLKHEAILWGASRGFESYLLGGGIRPGDGIFNYKKAFEPEGVVPFYVRRVVHNSGIYARLLALRIKHETWQGREWEPRDDFFPAFLS